MAFTKKITLSLRLPKLSLRLPIHTDVAVQTNSDQQEELRKTTSDVAVKKKNWDELPKTLPIGCPYFFTLFV